MKIKPEEVAHIAALARLELDGAEREALARDLGSILEHMKELGEVAVAGVAPMGGVSTHPAPMRADEPGADPLLIPVEALAPAAHSGFFTVPRLEALDADALAVAEEMTP